MSVDLILKIQVQISLGNLYLTDLVKKEKKIKNIKKDIQVYCKSSVYK